MAARDLEQSRRAAAERRVELDRTTNRGSRAGRVRAGLVLLRGGRDGELALGGLERHARSRPSSIAARIAAISVGVVPQQPPITRAPSSRACAANSAKYSGVACG